MTEPQPRARAPLARIVAGAAVGTAFEGYDYFVFGALSVILAQVFFPPGDPAAAFVFTLLTFAIGFVSRPLGALVFGRLGDRHGRKGAFMGTLLLMGAATVAIGLLPTYGQAGPLATALLVACRLIQGLALGGEYGGAVIYVAEHAPARARGLHASWIQTTGAVGLVLALGVVFAVRQALGEAAFAAWGWRLPFLFAGVLLGLTVWLRGKLDESPVFADMKARGLAARRPIAEVMRGQHLRRMLAVLFGLMSATGVIFYAGQFFAQFVLERIAKAPPDQVNILVLVATVAAAPLTVAFGALSDRVGRRPVILGGMLLMLATYTPVYGALLAAANPQLVAAQAAAPVVLRTGGAPCAPWSGERDPDSASCRFARSALAGAGVGFRVDPTLDPEGVRIAVGSARLRPPEVQGEADAATFRRDLARMLAAQGYPTRADPARMDCPRIVLLLVVLIAACAAVSGPAAAALAEFFPAQVRYLAVSLPYHLGLGLFGGFMPAIGFATIAATGAVHSGLWFAYGVTVLAVVVFLLWLPETRGRDLGATQAEPGDPSATSPHQAS